MTDDATEQTYAEIETKRFHKELPGTIGCVTTYAIIAMIACSAFLPMPFGQVVATCLVLLYIGSVLMFGQGSILEMGVMAVILLTLACLSGKLIGDVKQPSYSTPAKIENGG
ncbi:hypothetical protein [Stieleria varia]|uniref:Uncharacterized protein n=1 Tax=Stieleria varia TaxID=2528005 RepID=A0A5C6APK4_9BACT|nr:hypothetical protein [Stieleria varia]TWU01046.1 hypothetical protein Pla52n_44170 [Stieleria varia]